MVDAVDHLKIMNNALARIGAPSINSEDDDSDLAAQVVAVYYDRLDAMLSMYPWGFAGKTYKLDRLTASTENGFDVSADKFNNGWRYAFSLPGNRLGEPRRILDDPRRPEWPFRNFLIEAGILYADRDTLWATVTVRADPAVWRADFRLAVTALLAADLCVPVTHDANLAASLLAMGEGSPQENGRGGLIGRAMGADAASSPARAPMQGDPLSQARLS